MKQSKKSLIHKRIGRLCIMLGSILATSYATATLSEKEAIALGKKAYVYAYPLVLMDVTQHTMTNGAAFDATSMQGAPLNQFMHVSVFPTPQFKDIVRPNVDTLYSTAWLDLSQGPVLLHVPDTHERYYLLEMLDAWTNVFAAPGKRTTGTHAQTFALVGPNWKGSLPSGVTRIDAPTNMVWIIGRIQTNGKKDYEAVRVLQKGFALTPLHAGKPCTYPGVEKNSNNMLDENMPPVDQVAAMDAKTFYTTFAAALAGNPPSASDKPMLTQLKKIGIEPGKPFNWEGLPAEIGRGLQASTEPAQKSMLIANNSLVKEVNGWALFRSKIGMYGTDYALRAMIAHSGIGANIALDAVYPTTFVDDHGNPLDGSHNYVLHFNKNELPPVNAFWSVTLYNAQDFLVANPLQRYALGDRDPLIFNKDGSLDIYIQHTSPGSDKEANWLPTPLGNFNLTMRLYWPRQAVLNGTWNPPAINKQR